MPFNHGCRGGRGRGRSHSICALSVSRLQQQVYTIRSELHDANSGCFSKQTSVICLPPWEQYAKMFHTTTVCKLSGHELVYKLSGHKISDHVPRLVINKKGARRMNYRFSFLLYM